MPVVVVMCTCPRLGRFIVLATTVAVVSLVDIGPPKTNPVGSESERPGECHGSRSVLSERRWSTRMGVRGHGFRGVVQCATSAECILNLSIAVPVDKGPIRVSHTMCQ